MANDVVKCEQCGGVGLAPVYTGYVICNACPAGEKIRTALKAVTHGYAPLGGDLHAAAEAVRRDRVASERLIRVLTEKLATVEAKFTESEQKCMGAFQEKCDAEDAYRRVFEERNRLDRDGTALADATRNVLIAHSGESVRALQMALGQWETAGKVIARKGPRHAPNIDAPLDAKSRATIALRDAAKDLLDTTKSYLFSRCYAGLGEPKYSARVERAGERVRAASRVWHAATAPTPASTYLPAWCLPAEPLRSQHYEWWRPHIAHIAHLIKHEPMGEFDVPYRQGEGTALCGAKFEWTALSHPKPNAIKTRPLETCPDCDAMMLDAEPIVRPMQICRCMKFKGAIHDKRVSCVEVKASAAPGSVATSEPHKVTLPTTEQTETRGVLAGAARAFASLKNIGNALGEYRDEQALHHAAFRFVMANMRAYVGDPKGIGPTAAAVDAALSDYRAALRSGKDGQVVTTHAAILKLFDRACTPMETINWVKPPEVES